MSDVDYEIVAEVWREVTLTLLALLEQDGYDQDKIDSFGVLAGVIRVGLPEDIDDTFEYLAELREQGWPRLLTP